MTKLTWDNAALMAPSTAEANSLHTGDIIAIQHDGRTLNIPVWITPGHARDAITVSVGYGRTKAGRVGNGAGFNTYALRGSAAPWSGAATITKTGDTYDLVGTQDHWSIEGRNIIRSATLEEFKATPTFVKGMEHLKLDQRISLYADKEYKGDQWGMAIDMNACTGCSACIIACVAENNIPVVGKDQVKRNREMHWLRIDRYFAGNLDTPDTYYQPMPCQQCENAPCEVVCPVSATVHSDEGLNDMVYNRCVGTSTARTIVRGRCVVSTSCYAKTGRPRSSSCSAIRTSPSAAAASWRSALTACSASMPRAFSRSARIARFATAKS